MRGAREDARVWCDHRSREAGGEVEAPAKRRDETVSAET